MTEKIHAWAIADAESVLDLLISGVGEAQAGETQDTREESILKIARALAATAARVEKGRRDADLAVCRAVVNWQSALCEREGAESVLTALSTLPLKYQEQP